MGEVSLGASNSPKVLQLVDKLSQHGLQNAYMPNKHHTIKAVLKDLRIKHSVTAENRVLIHYFSGTQLMDSLKIFLESIAILYGANLWYNQQKKTMSRDVNLYYTFMRF